MIWSVVGVILVCVLVFGWSVVFMAGDADTESMREWDRQQAEWRRDGR